MSLLSSSRPSLHVLVGLAVLAVLVPLVSASPAEAASPVLVGVHAGEPSSTSDMTERVSNYENIIQRDVDVVNVFKALSMDNLVRPNGADTEEERLLKSGHTLMVSWRAHEGCGTGPNTTPEADRHRRARDLLTGQFDDELVAMARQLDQLTDLGPVLLRWHWEMDQEPNLCQHIGSPQEYAAAWRYVHGVVSPIAPDVQWVWAPRASSFNKDIGQQYWPGGQYVDLVGGSAVPRAANGKEGAWRGPAEIFDTMMEFADAKGRPALAWVGVREKLECLRPNDDCEWTPDATWKADFIDELRALAGGSWADTLAVLVWYHDLSPYFDDAYDFQVDTSWRSRNAMRTLVCDPAFGGCGTGSGGSDSGGSGSGGSGGTGSGGTGSGGTGSVGTGSGGTGSGGSGSGSTGGGTADTFTDDDTSVHEGSIEWLAAQGITRGCNPPANTRYCPEQSVTRAQMATFLVRALNLPDGQERFVDVASSDTHARAIGALAKAGITLGCNPPSNTRFCPEQSVTRAQMATFIDRALNLPNGQEVFADVAAGDTHAGAIGDLARAGITVGCNPPDNTRFCPDRAVTRGQMATFLKRALG